MRNTMRAKYNHKAAVLDCTFSDDAHAISGGIDRAVKVYVS
jgi:cell cycle arrest protein BUB3